MAKNKNRDRSPQKSGTGQSRRDHANSPAESHHQSPEHLPDSPSEVSRKGRQKRFGHN